MDAEPTSGAGGAVERFSWSPLLDLAVSIDLSLDEFWSMSLREFYRIVRVRSERMKAEHENAWMRTAVQTAYLYNVTGQAWFKDFKPISAGDLFDRWMGKAKPTETMAEKMARFKRAHQEIVKREGWT